MTGTTTPTPRKLYPWLALGAAMVAMQVALAAVSPLLDKHGEPNPGLLVGATLTMMAMGGAYLLAAMRLGRAPTERAWLIGMVAVGVAMRIAAFASTPIADDDYHRYLWDGAVTAAEANPYAVAPADVPDAPHLAHLAERAPDTLAKINHPELRTIYPPTAQAVFAAAHRVLPWRLAGLRLAFGVFDVLTLLAVMGLLRTAGQSVAWSAVYWCNPVLVQQVIGGGHMDLIAVALTAWAVLMAAQRRATPCALLLALAVGAKVWPVLLAPVLFASWLPRWRAVGAGAVTFALATALLYVPVFMTAMGDHSGFSSYAAHWDNNDLVFGLNVRLLEWLLPMAGGEAWSAGQYARYLTVAVVSIAAIATTGAIAAKRGERSPADLALAAVVIVGIAFVFSPTQFPWYYLWVLPWLAVRRSWALIAYAVTLPLYYLQPMGERVVWVQHAPIVAAVVGEVGYHLLTPRTLVGRTHA